MDVDMSQPQSSGNDHLMNTSCGASANHSNLMASNKYHTQSVAGSPVSTASSSSPRMSLTAAAVAAASAAASTGHRVGGGGGVGGRYKDPNQWEVISSSSSSSTSRQNSMECWDYTIELECLQGPEGGDLSPYFIFKFPRDIE